MDSILTYSKGIAAIIGTILTAAAAVLPEVPLWLKIAIAVVTAIGVIAIPNVPSQATKDAIIKAAVADPTSPVTIASPTTAEIAVVPTAEVSAPLGD